jgi:hypothetical protein
VSGSVFNINVFSLPSLNYSITDVAVSMQITSATEATFRHTVSTVTSPPYVPAGSIFESTPTHFSLIFLFSFFN